MVSAIEDIDYVVAVDPDPADLLERPAIRQLRPVGIDLISIVAASHDHRHIPSGDRFSLPQYEAQTRRKGKRGETLDSVSESESEWLYYIVDTLRKGQANLLI